MVHEVTEFAEPLGAVDSPQTVAVMDRRRLENDHRQVVLAASAGAEEHKPLASFAMRFQTADVTRHGIDNGTLTGLRNLKAPQRNIEITLTLPFTKSLPRGPPPFRFSLVGVVRFRLFDRSGDYPLADGFQRRRQRLRRGLVDSNAEFAPLRFQAFAGGSEVGVRIRFRV